MVLFCEAFQKILVEWETGKRIFRDMVEVVGGG
jgi:hypothetical protein